LDSVDLEVARLDTLGGLGLLFSWYLSGFDAALLLTPSARLLRNVPEKAEGFPFGMPPDHHELQSLVACQHGFSRAMRKALVFFRPITQRVEIVGASLRLSKEI
jgi:hypothetical protein